MNESLKTKLIEIRNQGWIKSIKNGPSGVGLTFESLLGKQADSFSWPDYEGIEIKAYRKSDRRRISLFSLVPDGDYLFPYERVLKHLGYPDKEYPMFKVLYIDLNTKEYSRINRCTYAKIVVDRDKEKIYIKALKFGEDTPLYVSWSFSEIIKRVEIKLPRLLLVETMKKNENDEEFFYYNNFKFYLLRNPSLFIDLIEKGIIRISIKLGIDKRPGRIGKLEDHGCSFTISTLNINKLYDLKDEI